MKKILLLFFIIINLNFIFSDDRGISKLLEEVEIKKEELLQNKNFYSASAFNQNSFEPKIKIKVKPKNENFEDFLIENNLTYRKAKYIDTYFLDVNLNEILLLNQSFDFDRAKTQTFLEPQLIESNEIIGNNFVSSNYNYSGEGQTIVIFDTPFDLEHEFIKNKIIDTACFSTNSYFGTFKYESSLCDDESESQIGGYSADIDTCLDLTNTNYSLCSHGTHVAGIAAGENISYNGDYLYGAAKDSNLIVVNVFKYDNLINSVGSYEEDRVFAFEHIYDLALNNPDLNISVISLSLGSSIGHSSYCDDESNEGEFEIIQKLRDDLGIISVFASGNDKYNTEVSPPSCFSNTISVGSMTKDLEISSFSNVAEILDFFAIGSSVLSSYPYSTNSYAYGSGTSMATPFFSGSYAVVKGAFPNWNYEEVLDAMSETGDEITNSQGITTPLINLTRLFLKYETELNYTTDFEEEYFYLNETEKTFYINYTKEIESYSIEFLGNYLIETEDNLSFKITLSNFSNKENDFDFSVRDIYEDDLEISKIIYYDNSNPEISYIRFIDNENNYFEDTQKIEFLKNYSLEILIEEFSNISYNQNGCIDFLEYNQNSLFKTYEICNINSNETHYVLNYDNFYYDNITNLEKTFSIEIIDLLNQSSTKNVSLEIVDKTNPQILELYLNNNLVEDSFTFNSFESNFNFSVILYDFSNVLVNLTNSFDNTYYNDFDIFEIEDYTKNYTKNFGNKNINSDFNFTFNFLDEFSNEINKTIEIFYPSDLFENLYINSGIENNSVIYDDNLNQSFSILTNKKISKYNLTFNGLEFSNENVYSDFFQIDFTLDSFGEKEILIELFDEYNYSNEIFLYNVEFLEYLGVDLDNDGIDDSNDTLIVDENIDLGVENLTIEVNGETNLSNEFSDTSLIEIKKDNTSFIEFETNLSEEKLDMTKVQIDYLKDTLSKIKISGLEGYSKKVYFEVSDNSKVLCVKNSQINDYSQISDDCSLSDEIKIEEIPYSENNIEVSLSGSIFELVGLSNTAVIQLDEELEEEESESTSDDDTKPRSSSGGGGGGSSSKEEVIIEIVYLNISQFNKVQKYLNYNFLLNNQNHTLSFLSNENETTYKLLIDGVSYLVLEKSYFKIDLDKNNVFDIEIFIDSSNGDEITFMISEYKESFTKSGDSKKLDDNEKNNDLNEKININEEDKKVIEENSVENESSEIIKDYENKENIFIRFFKSIGNFFKNLF